mmetsp:Transcript_21030/g.53500  ORF Transcript_21030/g.53500 Transcript_21030/m.53500 type:complete len:230 (-) Transcript_21030:19-708(-)
MSDDPDRNCAKCNKRVSLVETRMRCRCGLICCEKHRPIESHDCQFDWRGMQQQRLYQQHQRVHQGAEEIGSGEQWFKQYQKHHEEHGVLGRACHTAGFLILALSPVDSFYAFLFWGDGFVASLRGLVYCMTLGFATAHTLPALVEFARRGRTMRSWLGGCRYCCFSWDLTKKPRFVLAAEWEQAKEHLQNTVTYGRTNCITREVFSEPRTLRHILGCVWRRVQRGAVSC